MTFFTGCSKSFASSAGCFCRELAFQDEYELVGGEITPVKSHVSNLVLRSCMHRNHLHAWEPLACMGATCIVIIVLSMPAYVSAREEAWP